MKKNENDAASVRESDSWSAAKPAIERFKLESIRRKLTVRQVEFLTPRMLRVTLGGDELAGFKSPAPDDHIKLFIPVLGGEAKKRDYTPRRFDREALTLSVDFALHEGGAGSSWAQRVRPGDPLEIGGPRGSTVVSAPGAWWLLIGDETALPSVGRRLEEMASGTPVTTLMAVAGPEEEQEVKTNSDLTVRWVHRPDTRASDPEPMLKAVSELRLPAGPGFIWIAAEKEVARVLRAYFIETVGHPPEWIKAAAYWSRSSEEHD